MKPMTTRDTWVSISIRVAPTLMNDVSRMPITLITMSMNTIPMEAKVPITGDVLKGSQKNPR